MNYLSSFSIHSESALPVRPNADNLLIGRGASRSTSPLRFNVPFISRHAELDEELQACAKLRAETFYTYPPERAFAGQAWPLGTLSSFIFRYQEGPL